MDAPASGASELPHAVLARVLAVVGQRHRLRACARVCSAWRAAASTATSRIELSTATTAAFPRLSTWLEVQGRHVTSLSLEQMEPPLPSWVEDFGMESDDDFYYGTALMIPEPLEPEPLRLRPLPCAGLLELSISAPAALVLEGSDGGGGGSGGGGGAAAGTSGEHGPLTALLAAATGLTRLSLDGACLCSAAEAMAALARQPALRELSLSAVALQDVWGAMPALLRLTKLQFHSTYKASSQAQEPQHSMAPRAFGTSCPALRHLQLDVRNVGVDSWGGNRHQLATLVAGLPKLTHLSVRQAGDVMKDATAQAAFLAAVGQMQRLQSFSFDSFSSFDSEQPDAAAYAALTASSGLTSLMLRCPLPAALDAVFPAGRRLPHLVVCQLTPPPVALTCMWQPLELSSLVSACPALRELTLSAAAGSNLSALAAAAHLTKLSGSIAADCAAHIGQQTRLVELDLHLVRHGPDTQHASPNLMALTQLTRLQRITLSLLPEGLYTASRITYTNDQMALPWAGDTQGTPIWRQLFYTLLQCPTCRSGLDQQLLAACGAGPAAEVAVSELSAATRSIKRYGEDFYDAGACESYSLTEKYNQKLLEELQAACTGLWPIAPPNTDPAVRASEFEQLLHSVCIMDLGVAEVDEVVNDVMEHYGGALQALMAAGDTYLSALQAAAGGGDGGGSDADEQA